MKRGAEKQMTREGGSDDEIDEIESGGEGEGFKKAPEAALARREIRGLPKRSLTGSRSGSPASSPATPTFSQAPAAAASTSEPASTSRFAGFAFGGSSSSSATPFAFGSSASGTTMTSAFGSSIFGSSGGSSSTPAESPFASKPSPPVSSSASTAAKTFASFLGSASSSAAAPAASPTPNFVSTPAPTRKDEEHEKATKYYRSLRGLNVSFLSAISKAVESDPFVDVAQILEQYKGLRITVEKEYNERSSLGAPAPVTSKPAPPQAAMPAPPAAFSGFNLKPSSSSTSASTGGGFTPKVEASVNPSGFSFPAAVSSDAPKEIPKSNSFPFGLGAPPSASSSTSSPPKASFSFGNASTDGAPKSAFSFGAPSGSPPKSLFAASSSSALSLGASAPGSPKPSSLFGASPDPSASLFGPKTPAAFGGGTFGFPKSAVKGADQGKDTGDADKEKEKDTLLPGSGATSLFGSPLGTPTPGTPLFGSSSTPGPGAGAGAGAGTFGGFGRAGGSIGNPVGFGFGSPPRTPPGDAVAGESASPPKAFSFGNPFTMPAAGGAEKGEGGEGDEGAAPPPPKLIGTSEYDEEGEGEEDEETTHAIKSKVYRLMKTAEEAKWGDLGVGIIRLKKHKDTGSRRVLLRNSSTGKIVINFKVYGGLKPSLADKTISFIGHDEHGSATSYRIRVKTADQARDLKSAFDREIAFVKGDPE